MYARLSLSIKDLEEGMRISIKVYKITDKFDKCEQYSLTSQLRRSANSVIANIAESQGRYSYKDKIRVLYQARGEIFETRSHLKVAEGFKIYISK